MKKQTAAFLTICALTVSAITMGACGSSAAPGGGSNDNTPVSGTSASGDSGQTQDTQSQAENGDQNSQGSGQSLTSLISPRSGPAKVALVTSSGGLEDESFNQSAWEGLQRTVGAFGTEPLYAETRVEGTFTENLEGLINQGADLCWGIGYDCAGDMLLAAESHPGISFAIIDNYYENTPDNMTGVMFRAQEPSFLVGYVAGNVTQTGKVGFVGGETNEVIDQFEYGYKAGVAYAAKKLGKDIEVEAVYADTFSDQSAGRELANGLYDSGCDIVFHAAGQTGLGVIDAAKEKGTYAIGVDKDQSYLAPNNVLTSALKYVSVAVYQISGDFISGTQIGGKTISLGLSENAVGISGQHIHYSDELYDETMELQNEIIAGTIVPPTSEAEYEVFINKIG